MVEMSKNNNNLLLAKVKDPMRVMIWEMATMANPKPRVEEFGTSIMQIDTINWWRVSTLDSLPCELIIEGDWNWTNYS